jgi:hypothetical protein
MMKNQVKVYDKRGKLVDCDDGIVPDGCGVRTSFFLLDSLQRDVAANLQVTDAWGAPAGQRPGYVFDHRLTEAQEARDAAYDKCVKRLGDAWRKTKKNKRSPSTASPAVADRTLDTSDAAALRDQAYEDSVKRLADAWKTAR